MPTDPKPVGPLLGWTVFVTVMIVAGVVSLNVTVAALNPLLGVATLLAALLVLLAVGDRLGEQCVTAAMRAFRSCCRGAVRHLRADR